MGHIEEAQTLIRNLHQRMSPSAYDIAWLARLRDGEGSIRWPYLISWLLEHQNQDGSWGGEIEYYHDRIVSTLAALMALQESGPGPAVQETMRRGETYLWQHTHRLGADPSKPDGFELIFPTLLTEARRLGLDVPAHTYGYDVIRKAKINQFSPEEIYSVGSSIGRSLEFLGQYGNVGLMRQALLVNGSLGNSPSATAYYFHLTGRDERALGYLTSLPAIVSLYPFRSLELTQVLNNLALTELPLRKLAGSEIWEELYFEISAHGGRVDATLPVPNGDITAIALRLLLHAGYDVGPEVLQHFEDVEHHSFRTYDYERTLSVTTNVHALQALDALPAYPGGRELREQMVILLLDSHVHDMYWMDKGHASPHHATSQALVTLSGYSPWAERACRDTVAWLLHTQRADGSWGFYDIGTAEETAYVLLGLLHYRRQGEVDAEVLHRGAAYLEASRECGALACPQLWIGKSLYAPYDVIRSAMLAALILYEETFGRSP
ncbi:MAG: prenyltransferase/squalene oxidase repeat-containing protein [Anaerolineales bacterium]